MFLPINSAYSSKQVRRYVGRKEGILHGPEGVWLSFQSTQIYNLKTNILIYY